MFRRIGDDVTVGEFTVIKYPELITLGDHIRISDFSRITTAAELGDYVEIAPHCNIAGGGGSLIFKMKGYSSLAAGVKVWLSSNDYKNELVTHGLDGVIEIEGNVTMDLFTGVGSNSVIMPDNYIPEGTTIGALSFVPSRFDFEPWSIYAGCPIRKVGVRDKDHVLRKFESLKHLKL